MAYLIDTDIIVENLKHNEAVQRHLSERASIPKAISVITYGELLYGAKVSRQREKNLAIIRGLPDIFPIIGVGRAIIETFVEVKRSLEVDGQRIDDMDLLIAATALTMNYRLVSNNTKHFGRIKGLEIENWVELG
jgi:tRNA(fMet)-specific endonuclease VapC